MHEFQRCDLVTQTQIWFRNARLVHETEHAKAIIDADDDNVAELGEPCARIPIKRTGSRYERATVIPDQHRAALTIGLRRPDRKRQAVFVLGACEIPHRGGEARTVLRCHGTVLRRITLARPRLGRLGPAKAQLANGWSGVGYIPEGDDIAFDRTFKIAKPRRRFCSAICHVKAPYPARCLRKEVVDWRASPRLWSQLSSRLRQTKARKA